MGDEPSSSIAPRKMKFTPKIPPRKPSKTPVPKPEETASEFGDIMDHSLLRLVKMNSERERVREVKRREKENRFGCLEHKSASMEVTFGHTERRSSARSFGIPRTGNKSQDDGNISAAIQEKRDYVDPWDYCSYYPVTLPLRNHTRGIQLLDEEESGEASSTSIEEYDERKVDTAKELALVDGNADGRMFFFQLPVALPLGRRPETTTKGKETGGKMAGVSGNCCSLDDLPAGFVGKMLVYKSGVVKMKLGDAIFDVSPGSDCMFAQDVTAINTKQKHCCALGELNKRVVVRPNVDYLLNSVIQLD
ncbi:unnamed protein product [Spirodela intermedia]|uniref:Uncharacterized protein n=1 Tax=Spirodela intermedia TaxID=51605 RepID=A0A7I8JI61_SPIIN|nr:unnamed protein product [Spirodela intermedia]CAA6669838.1 unnamed protein product [Spirodela intermedia]